jgi:hypothetical protein
VALVVLPVCFALAAFIVARLLSISLAWAIVVAMGCCVFCFAADGGALLLRGLGQFFSDF